MMSLASSPVLPLRVVHPTYSLLGGLVNKIGTHVIKASNFFDSVELNHIMSTWIIVVKLPDTETKVMFFGFPSVSYRFTPLPPICVIVRLSC